MLNYEMLAIEPTTYQRWADMARGHVQTSNVLDRLQSPEAAARMKPSRRNAGAVAVVSVNGFISQKPTFFSEIFGGTSIEAVVASLRAAVEDPTVGSIVLNVDSPGGSVFGLAEAAESIRALRGKKPIVAVANPVMASAAYYLAAQADEVVASPSALTGSIGTIAVILDDTEALEKIGVKVEVFTYGERKAESMPPLDDAGREAIQSQVDYYGAMFEGDVAKGRRVSKGTVRARYGQGAVFNANDALASGVVDRIATLEAVVGDLAAGRKPRPRVAAEDTRVQRAAWAVRLGLNFGQDGLE